MVKLLLPIIFQIQQKIHYKIKGFLQYFDNKQSSKKNKCIIYDTLININIHNYIIV